MSDSKETFHQRGDRLMLDFEMESCWASVFRLTYREYLNDQSKYAVSVVAADAEGAMAVGRLAAMEWFGSERGGEAELVSLAMGESIYGIAKPKAPP